MNTPSNVAPMKDLDPQMSALVREEVERLLAARSGESAKEDLETRVTALERRAPQNKVSIVTEMGTRMIGCTMAMDLMGIKQTELIPGVQLGGVATFMDEALNSRLTLFL